MRIRYTIPSLAPPVEPEAPAAIQSPTFRSRLRGMSIPVPKTWRRLLGLDQSPPDATFIGPPPKPASLEIADPAEERMRWRNLLERHPEARAGNSATDPSDPVQRMMALLVQYRQRHDEVVARSLSESGET